MHPFLLEKITKKYTFDGLGIKYSVVLLMDINKSGTPKTFRVNLGEQKKEDTGKDYHENITGVEF